MADLVEWLEAQLRADEAIARAATPGPWVRERAFSTWFVTPESADTTAAGNVSRLKPSQKADATHIAANDPAAVLRTIAAHRAILKLHKVSSSPNEGCLVCDEYRGYDYAPEPCETVRLLAAIYELRDGFDPSWTVENR